MANIDALKREALDRAIEALELEIEKDVLKIRLKTEQLSRLKDKEAKSELREEILWAENRIAKNKIKLDALKKLTPEQFVEGRAIETAEECVSSIERVEEFLVKTQNQPDEKRVRGAKEDVRYLIEEDIRNKKIKAPKTEKKCEQFIEELLQTPEYQEQIQKMAWEQTQRDREDAEERLERDMKLLSILDPVDPDSEEFLQHLIEELKGWICWTKERICGLDISRIFEIPQRGCRYPEQFDDHSVLKVIAQIPQEEYLENVRPKLIRAVESVLSEYNHDAKVLLAKKVGVGVASLATWFVGGPISGVLGTVPGLMVAISTNSEAGTYAGVGLAALGGIAGIAGAIAASNKIGEKADNFAEVQYEAYIKKEIERILTEEGYMQKEGSEAVVQPGEE